MKNSRIRSEPLQCFGIHAYKLRPGHRIDKLLDALIAMAKPVYRAFFWRPLLRDANDDMVLEAAMSRRADFIVTFNRRDFEPAASQLGIAIVSPQEALGEMRRRNENK